MDFAQIAGHQKQIQMLKYDLDKKKPASAYLFAGPEQIGKFSVAKFFAEALQCHGLDDNKRISLLNQIKRGIHMDTIILNEGKNEKIGIESVKNALSNLQMTGNSNYRILLIKNIERMTAEASNAMLKTLEEPENGVIFIFTTTKAERVLETVLSRVRKIDFHALSKKEIIDYLKRFFRLTDIKIIEKAAELSLGKIGKAIKLLENPQALEAYENLYSQIKDFLKNKDIENGFAFIEDIYKDKELLEMTIDLFFVALRDQMKEAIAFAEKNGIIIDESFENVKNIEKMHSIKKILETNINSRLVLENFVLNL